MASYSTSRFALKVEKDFAIQLTDSQLRLQKRIHGTEATNIVSGVEHAGPRMDLPEFSLREQDENNALLLRKALNNSNTNTRHSTGAIVSNADRKAMLRKILAQKSRSRAAAIGKAVEHEEQNHVSSKHSAPVEQHELYLLKSTPVPLRQQEPNQTPVKRHPSVQKQSIRHPVKSAPQITTSSALHQDVSKSDTSGSATTSKDDQKALLRKVLANSRAKRQNAAEQRISPRSSLMESQKKAISETGFKRESLPFIRPDVPKSQGRLSPRLGLMQSQRKSMVEIRREAMTEAPQGQPIKDSLLSHQPSRLIRQGTSNRENAALDQKRAEPEFTAPIRRHDPSQSTKTTLESQARPMKSPSKNREILTATSRSQHSDMSHRSSEILTSSRMEFTDKPAKLKDITPDVINRPKDPTRNSDSQHINPSRLRLPPPEQELDSYGAFFSVLQKEGANDHRELFRSFRSIFYSGKVELTEKQKRVKFDSRTKKTLTEMNLYLKRVSDMECKAETQLVNDKKFAKEGGHRQVSPRGLMSIFSNLVAMNLAPTQAEVYACSHSPN
ncbi:hypothetical protein MHU86_18361 [Fragilaria crotonensis]|nr:hypothetical protein MHU86_18361 [Fragilaria crotonensis]